MALGNNMSMGQARGKAKPVMVKRIKEFKIAENYTAFNSGPVAANAYAACSGSNTGNTFYHNGSSAIPVVDDIVYRTKRARNPNTFTAGFYKVAAGGKGNVNIQINSSGVCIARANC